jgi:hypothetical protein
MKNGLYANWFGATGGGSATSASDTAALNNAVAHLHKLNQQILNVTEGNYVLAPTAGVGVQVNGIAITVNCQGTKGGNSYSVGTVFTAGADNMVLWKFGVSNDGTVGMHNCTFDGGATSQRYTGTDDVYLDTVVSPDFSGNLLEGIPTGHAGYKGGGILYGNFGPDIFRGAGRCIDFQESYGSVKTYYGANVTTFTGVRSAGACAQGFRASGIILWQNMDCEAYLASTAKACFDFTDPNAYSDVTMIGGYTESYATSANQSAVLMGSGRLSMVGGQFEFVDTRGGSASRCLTFDLTGAYTSGLGNVFVKGNTFTGCDTGMYFNLGATTGGTGTSLPLNNFQIDIGANTLAALGNSGANTGYGCQFGSLAILQSYQNAGYPVNIECPDANIGRIMSGKYTGTVPFQVCHATYNFALDGGDVGTITPHRNCALPYNAIVVSAQINWSTRPASRGMATVAIGINNGAGTAALQAATAIGSLNGIVQGVPLTDIASTHFKLANSNVLYQVTVTPAVAPLTAGVCEIWVWYVQNP